MPPKIKIPASEIVETAFNLVRKNGYHYLNARAIANELGVSTSPIYVHFPSMEALEEEVIKKTFDLLKSYQTKSWSDDSLFNPPIGYVHFAIDEPNLFSAINQRKFLKFKVNNNTDSFEEDLAAFSDSLSAELKPFSPEQRRYLFYIIYNFLQGISYTSHTNKEAGFRDAYLEQLRLDDFIRDAVKIILRGYIQTRTQRNLKTKKKD